MPRYTWAADPNNIISGFETRHAQPDSGALLAWAVLSVESLHYLADIDQDYEVSHQVVGGHSRDIADVAHARWATGTCITSLDLCAAALARTFCGHKSSRELALPDFDTSKSSKKAPKLLAALPRSARDWMRDLLSDEDFYAASRIIMPPVCAFCRGAPIFPPRRVYLSSRAVRVERTAGRGRGVRIRCRRKRSSRYPHA